MSTKEEAKIIECISEDDRRRERRIECHTPAQVTLVQLGYTCPGIILDASSNGLRVRTGRHVGKGWEVQITIGTAVAFGEVRYCVESKEPGKYEFGVLVLNVRTPYSK